MNKFRIKKVVYNGEKKYIVQKRFMFIFWFKYYHAVEGDALIYKIFDCRYDANYYVDYLNSE